MPPSSKEVFTKAHIIKLFRGARRTDFKGGNSLEEFEKVVLVHTKVNCLSGMCHTIGRNTEGQYLHRREKRIQKHDKAALTNAPESSTLTGKESIKHHQVGMRYSSREISTSGVQVSQ